jgi:hypothetical protein
MTRWSMLERVCAEKDLLETIFDVINCKVFDGELPACPITMTDLGRGHDGVFFFRRGCPEIHISRRLPFMAASIVLLHEMIHYQFWVNEAQPPEPHGDEFQKALVKAGVLDEHRFRIAQGSPMEHVCYELMFKFKFALAPVVFSRVLRTRQGAS